MQRSFEYIFECLEKEMAAAESNAESYQFEYLIRCSYLEIYNEQILDLLEPTSVNLHIREDIKKGVYVEGLQEEVVLSAEDMINII
jgi:kinesin family protein 15